MLTTILNSLVTNANIASASASVTVFDKKNRYNSNTNIKRKSRGVTFDNEVTFDLVMLKYKNFKEYSEREQQGFFFY